MTMIPQHYLVLANPSQDSFDHAVARAYANATEQLGQSTTICDLYATLFDPVLKESERFDRDNERTPWVEAELEQLAACGAVVLVYPIWFGGPPAMLKGYVDRVLGAQCGLADVQAGGAQRMLRGRYLLSISTSGSTNDWLIERGQQRALREGFDIYIERGLGLRDGGHTNLDGIVRNMSSAKASAALALVTDIAKTMCSKLSPAARDKTNS